MFGNSYGNSGELAGRRNLGQSIPVTFFLPPIPNFSGAERPWTMPSQENLNATVVETRGRIFPRGKVLTASHTFEEPDGQYNPTPSHSTSSILTRSASVNIFVSAIIAKAFMKYFL